MKHHPTATRVMQPNPPRRNSRRPKGPRCSPTRKSAPPTTSTATRGWTPTCAAPGWSRRVWRLCRGVLATSSATCSASRADAGARWPPGVPWQRSQLRHGDHAGRSSARQGCANPHPLGFVRHLPRQRCQTRHQRQDLRHLPGLWHGADAPGLLQRAANLPALPRHGKIIPEPCTACHGQGKIKQKTLEVKIPAGIDDGMRIRSTGNGEPGHQRRPAGRPVHRDPHQEARHLRARWRRPALPGARELHHGGLGGEIEVPTLAGKAAIDIP